MVRTKYIFTLAMILIFINSIASNADLTSQIVTANDPVPYSIMGLELLYDISNTVNSSLTSNYQEFLFSEVSGSASLYYLNKGNLHYLEDGEMKSYASTNEGIVYPDSYKIKYYDSSYSYLSSADDTSSISLSGNIELNEYYSVESIVMNNSIIDNSYANYVIFPNYSNSSYIHYINTLQGIGKIGGDFKSYLINSTDFKIGENATIFSSNYTISGEGDFNGYKTYIVSRFFNSEIVEYTSSFEYERGTGVMVSFRSQSVYTDYRNLTISFSKVLTNNIFDGIYENDTTETTDGTEDTSIEPILPVSMSFLFAPIILALIKKRK